MEETNSDSSLPTTSMSTVLPSPSAGLWRFSQEDIAQSATGVTGLIWHPPPPGVEWLSSSSAAKPLQVLSIATSNSSLVPTLPSSTMLQSHPGTETVIGTLGRIRRVLIQVGATYRVFLNVVQPQVIRPHGGVRPPALIYHSSTRLNASTSW